MKNFCYCFFLTTEDTENTEFTRSSVTIFLLSLSLFVPKSLVAKKNLLSEADYWVKT
jgi:hypothetical protein